MATKRKINANQIVLVAVQLAEQSSWEAVRLFDVAQKLKISLTQIKQHFAEKEALTKAWFDQADQAMLDLTTQDHFQKLNSDEQVLSLIMAWLSFLKTHKKPTKEMIVNKLEPGHIHVQFPALLRISRTVQWIREAANRQQTFASRALDETKLTMLFVATFIYWLNIEQNDLQRASDFLSNRLDVEKESIKQD